MEGKTPTVEELLAAANRPAQESMRLHPYYRGKVQTLPKCAIRGLEDFAIWYTPGVAAPCKAIQSDPASVFEFTNKGNTVAIVTDGTRVLGLGDIGPEAGLPMMEGKALLFKYLGGVDAVPICLATRDPEEIVRTVKLLQPAFGAINLEDIAQPKCFRILDRLRAETTIPVWHDDQQGTATVVLAGLINALKLTGRRIETARIAMIGMGAANVATYRLLKVYGADPARIVACDSRGTLHRGRADVEQARAEYPDKWTICQESNGAGVAGGIAEAVAGADVCVAFSSSRPGVLRPEWLRGMAGDAIVFACANPTPEVWPWEAKAAGVKVVATGRSDFANQVNNSLVFPPMFRGVLDVRARTITDEMAIAAARELAACAERRGMDADNILPRMDEWDVYPEVAAAVGMAAQTCGVARRTVERETLRAAAAATMQAAREATRVLMREGLIPAPP
ncbi:MAG: NADP-dependent malic enzyme [Gammaproteobacteria bacterium]